MLTSIVAYRVVAVSAEHTRRDTIRGPNAKVTVSRWAFVAHEMVHLDRLYALQ